MTKTQIPELLDGLRNQETYTRNDAIKRIIKEKINDEQVIVALKEVIENDQSMVVRNFARSALDVFGVEHSATEESTAINSRNSDNNISHTEGQEMSDTTIERANNHHKSRDVLLGFFGWFLVGNLLFWILQSVMFPFVIPLITVIVIVILFMTGKNWFAYGIISAVITNILFILILGSLILSPSAEGYLDLLLFGVLFPLPLGVGALMI